MNENEQIMRQVEGQLVNFGFHSLLTTTFKRTKTNDEDLYAQFPHRPRALDAPHGKTIPSAMD